MNDVERDREKIMKELADKRIAAIEAQKRETPEEKRFKEPITPDLSCAEYSGKSDMKAMTDRCNAGAREQIKKLHSEGKGGPITRPGGGK